MLFTNKDLKKLIIPLVIEQVLAVSVGMADTMMISFAGEAAVSGVSLVDMVNNLLLNVFAALATGGAVVVSQLLGKRKPQDACDSARQLLMITAIASILIMAICLAGNHLIIRLCFGAIEEDVFEACSVYFLISALSYPFLGIYNACAALFRSMNDSKTSMKVAILMNLINFVLNAVFIFGMKWGVAGAAIASLIARFAAAVIMCILLYRPELMVNIASGKSWRLDYEMGKKILRIGIPSGLENSIFQLGRVIVVGMIAGFGTVQIAANAVANNMDSMGCIPAQAMNLAMITVIGRCVGAGDREGIVFYVKKLMKLTYVIMIAWNCLILATLSLTLNIYQISAETRSLAVILVWIHDGGAMLLWPASFTLPNALRAANDVRFPMWISIFSMWVFRIGLSYLLGVQLGYGAIGVWIGMIVDWIFRVICFVTRFLRGRWKQTMYG